MITALKHRYMFVIQCILALSLLATVFFNTNLLGSSVFANSSFHLPASAIGGHIVAMNRIRGITFSHIFVRDIKVKDRKKYSGYFYSNVYFTLKRTGQKFQQVRKYSKKRAVRDDALQFCTDINEQFKHAPCQQDRPSVSPGFESDSALEFGTSTCGTESSEVGTGNQDENEDKKMGAAELEFEDISFRHTFSCEPSGNEGVEFSDDNTANDSTQVPSADAFVNQNGHKLQPSHVMKLVHVEVMGKLKEAINSGNFSELWDGPYLEMEGKDGVKFVSDCTPYQQSQLIQNATALFYYEE
jgi:hypothetical protein